MSRFPFVRVLAALCVVLGASLARGAEDKDDWYIVEMMGQRAGWMHNRTTTKDGKITSTSKMQIEVGRGTLQLQVSMESAFVETTEGKPVSMTAIKKMASSPVTEKYTFNEDGSISYTSEQGSSHRTSTLPKPEGVWLPPAAMERFVVQRFKSGAKEIEVRTIDPTEGVTPVTVKRTGFEKTTLTVDGRKLDATKIKVETAIPQGEKKSMVVPSTEYVDDDGDLIQSDTSVGGMVIKTIVSTRAKALEAAAPPEIMVSTFIKPDRAIHDPRATKKLVIVASVPDGEFPDLPRTGFQRVEPLGPHSARLTITTENPSPAPQADALNPAYLAATSMANIDDPKIKELAKEAVKNAGSDAAAKAEACRRFVNQYIKTKGLDVGFATASEVARNREGDCTEHGVFLTALLRANGIPARAATGLLYAEEFAGGHDIFGYHMWAQALLTIDGKPCWVDLDGTLPPGMRFDATHIALSTTDLADGDATSGLAELAPLMGRLAIKIESVGE